MKQVKDIFELIIQADTQLHEGDSLFVELTEHILELLRAKAILPVRRISENNELHRLASGLLVASYIEDSDIYMSSRRTNAFVARGVSTQMMKWLDAMVAKGVLNSPRENKAEGRLSLTEDLLDYIATAPVSLPEAVTV